GVIGVLAGAVIGAVGPAWVFAVTAAAVGLYLAASAATAAVIAWHLRAAVALPVAFVLFPATHAAYGLGMAIGLLRPQRSKLVRVDLRIDDLTPATVSPPSL